MRKLIPLMLVALMVATSACKTQKVQQKVKPVTQKEQTVVVKKLPNWVQFTEQIRSNKDYNLTPESKRLDSLQFCSGPIRIVLERSVVENGTVIAPDGQLVTKNINKIFRDTIKPYTPGVEVGLSNNMLEISYGGDNSTLVYGPDGKGAYILYGLNGKNEVYYEGYNWKIISGQNGLATLYFDWNYLTRTLIKGKTIPGRLVGGN